MEEGLKELTFSDTHSDMSWRQKEKLKAKDRVEEQIRHTIDGGTHAIVKRKSIRAIRIGDSFKLIFRFKRSQIIMESFHSVCFF